MGCFSVSESRTDADVMSLEDGWFSTPAFGRVQAVLVQAVESHGCCCFDPPVSAAARLCPGTRALSELKHWPLN